MKMLSMLLMTSFLTLISGVYSQTPKPPISPKWVFEPWVWEDSIQTKYAALNCLNGYTSRGIPVGAIIIDSPWEEPIGSYPYVNNSSDQGYNTFKFEWEYYPYPKAFIDSLHERNIKVILWISGNMTTNSPYYNHAKDQGYFIKDHNGETLVTKFWRGNRWGSHINFFNPNAVAYWDTLMDMVLDNDTIQIDGWKVDQSDYHLIDHKDDIYDGTTKKTMREYQDAYYGHIYERTIAVKGSDVGMITARPYCKELGKDPNGLWYAPIWANPAGWVGDQEHNWPGLQLALKNIFISAEAGYSALGSDIGGFAKAINWDYDSAYIAPEKTLFVRWAQMGALMPIMENGGQSDLQHMPWHFDTETVDIYRYYALLHHHLVPYFYSYGVAAHLNGISITRPIGNSATWPGNWFYLLGDNLFISVIGTVDTVKSVTFPDGKWIDYWNEDSIYNGRTTKSFNYDLTKFPIFIKSGAIISLNVDNSETGHGSSASKNYLTLLVYPDGLSSLNFYQSPADAADPLIISCDDNSGDIEISFNKEVDSIIVRLKNDFNPMNIMLNGGISVPKKNSFTEFESSSSGWFRGQLRNGENIYTWIKISGTFDSIFVNQTCALSLYPSNYQLSNLTSGNTYYVDRTYKLVSIPTRYQGLNMIKTANNDKSTVGLDFHFNVCCQSDIYIAYDHRATFIPAWITNNYVQTNETITVDDAYLAYFNIWKRTVEAGTVTCGDNEGTTHSSMYFVFYKSLEASAAKSLDLTSLLEGFFNGSSMIPDTVKIELRTASAPHELIDATDIVLNETGNASANFFYAANSSNYYVVLKHRNSIETWSKLPQQFIGGSLTYDFTTAAAQAYDDNMKLKGSKWCIYGGEIANGDQYIDGDDVTSAYNAQGLAGYVIQDVTGDNYVDADDVTLIFNNQGVNKVVP